MLIEDWDPSYLPDGGIAFISTCNQAGMRSHFGGQYCPSYTLYRMAGDGSQIRPLVFGEVNEWEPSVLWDGRIIWTRWDFINRHDTLFQGLWTIRPDGGETAHFYGNYTRNPCGVAEARSIPGSPKIVATAFANHSYTAGSIVVIDQYQASNEQTPSPWGIPFRIADLGFRIELYAKGDSCNPAGLYALFKSLSIHKMTAEEKRVLRFPYFPISCLFLFIMTCQRKDCQAGFPACRWTFCRVKCPPYARR